MRTSEKYAEMGFVEVGKGKVQDKHGQTYYPKKAKVAVAGDKIDVSGMYGHGSV